MTFGKAVRLVSVAAIAVGVFGGVPSGAGQSLALLPDVPRAEAQGATPVYKPPLRGAPGGRVGGGTRGISGDTVVVSVLAPDHTGLTSEESPTLYWFVSKSTDLPVEITVTDPDDPAPVLELRLTGPTQAGIRKVALADHGARLRPGVTYQWYVALVPDPKRRARDILSGGTITRVALADGLREKLEGAQPWERPAMYAEAGLWYDAVAEIHRLIAATPGDPSLKTQRASLIAQVGLKAIADHEP
jgi:hypothetical protein